MFSITLSSPFVASNWFTLTSIWQSIRSSWILEMSPLKIGHYLRMWYLTCTYPVFIFKKTRGSAKSLCFFIKTSAYSISYSYLFNSLRSDLSWSHFSFTCNSIFSKASLRVYLSLSASDSAFYSILLILIIIYSSFSFIRYFFSDRLRSWFIASCTAFEWASSILKIYLSLSLR